MQSSVNFLNARFLFVCLVGWLVGWLGFYVSLRNFSLSDCRGGKMQVHLNSKPEPNTNRNVIYRLENIVQFWAHIRVLFVAVYNVPEF